MIGGMQIGLLILGSYYLIMGKPPKWIQRDTTAKFVPAPGWPTRLVGAILMLPYPASFLAGFAIGIWWVAQGKNVADNSLATVARVIDGTTLAVCILAASIVRRLTRIPVEELQVGGGVATDSSLITPPSDIASATQWNVRSIGIKMVGCALIAVVIVSYSVYLTKPPHGKAPSGRTAAQLAGTLLFTAITGALIGYFLALRDYVLERRSRGLRVHPMLRAYFSWGIVSLLLWVVTLFAAGIGGIVLYYSFLSPGVGRAG
jgi:hypothetical protein